MKLNHLATAIATTTLMINTAYAGGLERSQQSVGALFSRISDGLARRPKNQRKRYER